MEGENVTGIHNNINLMHWMHACPLGWLIYFILDTCHESENTECVFDVYIQLPLPYQPVPTSLFHQILHLF